MNTIIKQMACSIAIGLLAASIALAESSPQSFEKMRKAADERFEAVMKELNLNPEQQQQIVSQRNKDKEEESLLRGRMKALRSQLSDELEKEATDKAKVYGLLAEMKELIGRRIERKVEGVLSLKKILTPEQFKTLHDKQKQFFERKEGGRP